MNTIGELRVLTEAEAEAIAKTVLSNVRASEAVVRVHSTSTARSSFVRNDVHNISGGSRIAVQLQVCSKGKYGLSETTDTDIDGLIRLVRDAEMAAEADRVPTPGGMKLRQPNTFPDNSSTLPANASRTYYEATLKAGLPKTQGELVRQMATLTETGRTIGAGDITVSGSATLILNTLGYISYNRNTFGEYSATARIPERRGSGWGWVGSEDFSTIDLPNITRHAIDVAHRSVDPVAVEPGRYTVLLEPTAVAQLVAPIIGLPTDSMGRLAADRGETVFSILKNKMPAGNRIGQQMTDSRMQLLSNPFDPTLPHSLVDEDGNLARVMSWFKDGVLQALAYGPNYGAKLRLEPLSLPEPSRVRLDFSGISSNTDEMIRSTQRGIWVHRFDAVNVVHKPSLLLSGVTRDGTFLIERGQVTKSVKNFRFLESPFFAFAKVDAFGKPERAAKNLLVPRLLVHDFQFSSLSEAF